MNFGFLTPQPPDPNIVRLGRVFGAIIASIVLCIFLLVIVAVALLSMFG